MKQRVLSLSDKRKNGWLFLIGLSAAFIIAGLTYWSMMATALLTGICAFTLSCIVIFNSPKAGLLFLVAYCFLYTLISREVGGTIPFGMGIEAIFVLTLIAVVFRVQKERWTMLRLDLFVLTAIWFIISVLEVANPAGASVRGWLQEIRSTALYPLLIVFAGLLLFRTKQDLNLFLIVVFGLSLLATLNGLKQHFIGLSPGESRFLADGGAVTHLIFGRLRVFSFYSDAGQFGASQAHFAIMAIILSLGNFKWWKRILLAIVALLSFYGMLISGTRGALFALVVAAFFAIFLSKNFKVLIAGTTVALLFLCFLKYTTIGSGNYEIYRLRTALDPQDASLNVRFVNQQILRNYLATRPFGGGLGVIGANGEDYNADKFLSTIAPDSYWVKIWVMYGIVGFTCWFSMIMYILGKCSAIIWNIKDSRLRVKLIALASGAAGIFFSSYGNEVMNTMPSAIVVYLSFVLIYLAPGFDQKIAQENRVNLNK